MSTGIAIQHLFVGTFQGMHFESCGIGVDLGGIDDAGSVSIIDSTAVNTGVVVNGSASLVLENLHVTRSGPVLRINNQTKVAGSLDQKTYVFGHLYTNNDDRVTVSNGTLVPYTKRGTLTDTDGLYLAKPQPQYTEFSASAFVSVKDHGAKGMLLCSILSAVRSHGLSASSRRRSNGRYGSDQRHSERKRKLQDYVLSTRRVPGN